MDPFHSFSAYPTKTISRNTLLELADVNPEKAFKRIIDFRKLTMIDFAKRIIPREDEILSVLEAANNGPEIAINLISGISNERKAFVFRSLAWFIKLGILNEYNQP